jgi:hypothetical protein
MAFKECDKCTCLREERDQLRAELASIPKATIGDVSYYGTLAEPALLVELADTRAENERLKGALREAVEWLEDDRADDEYIMEDWYHAAKQALGAAEGEESGAKED